MREDIVARLRQAGTFSEDPLTEILRLGVRRLLAQAVEIDVTAYVEGHVEPTVTTSHHGSITTTDASFKSVW